MKRRKRTYTYPLIFFLSFIVFCFTSNLAAAQQSVIINEFMASNSSTLSDMDGEYSDWIELYNPTQETVNLDGWSLTDEESKTELWKFPNLSLNPGNYLIVFASGKNIPDPTGELHTDFKIDKEGEYLALIDNNGNEMSVFVSFPELSSDQSYSFYNGEYLITTSPSPGSENAITGNLNLTKPGFNMPHGFYDETFELEISSDDSEVQIYYTLDGSIPDANTSTLYTSPLRVNTTTVIRAASILGELKSETNTSTYLFVENVIDQPNDPAGYPEVWGEFYESDGTAPADYEMDPELTRDIKYKDLLDDALLDIPTLSIVTNKNHLFSHSINPDSGGIYIYTGNYGTDLGKGWERPASVEIFNSTDGLDFQENVALELHGGASRLSDKTPKHSFRLTFKKKYGSGKLNYPIFGDNVDNSFNSVVLRAGYGNTWLHRSANERRHTTLLHDLWGKDTQLDMGHSAGHGRFFHLYLNGMYWGIYNPTERIDTEFAVRNFGGEESDYDIIKDYGEVVDGSGTSWNEMLSLSREDLSFDEYYFRLIGKNPDGTENPDLEAYLDLENFIDYMLINLYGSNWDWDHHNWVAIRNRVNPDKGFKFFSWDAEHILEDIDENILDINYEARPSELFQNLTASPHFRLLLADRVYKHFFNKGAMTPEAGINRLMRRAEEIELAIIAESQRWGDYRRDVHSSYPGGPFELYTKDHWLQEISFLVDDYFPQRGDVFLGHLRDAGLIPLFNPPDFLVNNKENPSDINAGDTLSLSPTSGIIYYTLNGVDPVRNGEIIEDAFIYDEPFTLDSSVTVMVRSFRRDEWSALNEKFFKIAEDTVSTSNIDLSGEHPLAFSLKQNYPNPFNPSTVIDYYLPNQGFVDLTVFDVLGRQVETLIHEYQSSGSHSVAFDALNLSSGIYLYQLKFDESISTKKMFLIK